MVVEEIGFLLDVEKYLFCVFYLKEFWRNLKQRDHRKRAPGEGNRARTGWAAVCFGVWVFVNVGVWQTVRSADTGKNKIRFCFFSHFGPELNVKHRGRRFPAAQPAGKYVNDRAALIGAPQRVQPESRHIKDRIEIKRWRQWRQEKTEGQMEAAEGQKGFYFKDSLNLSSNIWTVVSHRE